MVVLDLKDYCNHGCMNFEPRVNKHEEYLGEGSIYIRCENAKTCEYMIRYLKNHAKEDINVPLDESVER